MQADGVSWPVAEYVPVTHGAPKHKSSSENDANMNAEKNVFLMRFCDVITSEPPPRLVYSNTQ
jgi:hypothetical protein